MEINSIAHLATALAQQRSAQDVSVAVLKKAMQVQQGTASALLASLAAGGSRQPAVASGTNHQHDGLIH